MVTSPSVGISKPPRRRGEVVFPQALGPSREKNSPSRIWRVTSRTATTSPKRFDTPRSSTANGSVKRPLPSWSPMRSSPEDGKADGGRGARRTRSPEQGPQQEPPRLRLSYLPHLGTGQDPGRRLLASAGGDVPLVDVLEDDGDNQRAALAHAGDLGDHIREKRVHFGVVAPDNLDADVDVAHRAGDVGDAVVGGQAPGDIRDRFRLDLDEDIGDA